jgi:CheY-like chemotaxis protein
MDKIKLLIVDDDIDDIVLLNDAFEGKRSFIDIGFLANPEGVMAHLQQLSEEQLPHLIITDLNMPKVDGFKLLHELKADERLKSIPVIVCSTSVSPHDRSKALQLGAKDFITKPISLNNYSETVDKIVASFSSDKMS